MSATPGPSPTGVGGRGRWGGGDGAGPAVGGGVTGVDAVLQRTGQVGGKFYSRATLNVLSIRALYLAFFFIF